MLHTLVVCSSNTHTQTSMCLCQHLWYSHEWQHPTVSFCVHPAAAGARAASVQEQSGYLLNQVEALGDVGVPACFALLVANQDGSLVTSESFFFTSS